jgi:two-component system, OmpR family, sensor kinase
VLAAEPNPSREDIQRVQRLVSAEIARTSRLVDDMLLLARSEHQGFLRRDTIDLAPFLEDLWSATTAGHHRRFELGRLPAGRLQCDPDRLAQALRNLIDNAISHTAAPDGQVCLDVSVLPGGGVRFTVANDGPEIPEEQRERIFDRFHRTDEARNRIAGGAGLGLAIVRAIAQVHGGSVRAVAPVVSGARFELDLPGPLRRAAELRHSPRSIHT